MKIDKLISEFLKGETGIRRWKQGKYILETDFNERSVTYTDGTNEYGSVIYDVYNEEVFMGVYTYDLSATQKRFFRNVAKALSNMTFIVNNEMLLDLLKPLKVNEIELNKGF